LQKDYKISNKFLYVHDDTFGREFYGKADIEEYLKDCKFKLEVEVISKNSCGVNVFLLNVISELPIDNTEVLEDLDTIFFNLNWVKYYHPTECDFNLSLENYQNGGI